MGVQNQGREYFEAHAIKKHPMSFECDICGKVLDENKTSKAILNQFMRGKNQ